MILSDYKKIQVWLEKTMIGTSEISPYLGITCTRPDNTPIDSFENIWFMKLFSGTIIYCGRGNEVRSNGFRIKGTIDSKIIEELMKKKELNK